MADTGVSPSDLCVIPGCTAAFAEKCGTCGRLVCKRHCRLENGAYLCDACVEARAQQQAAQQYAEHQRAWVEQQRLERERLQAQAAIQAESERKVNIWAKYGSLGTAIVVAYLLSRTLAFQLYFHEVGFDLSLAVFSCGLLVWFFLGSETGRWSRVSPTSTRAASGSTTQLLWSLIAVASVLSLLGVMAPNLALAVDFAAFVAALLLPVWALLARRGPHPQIQTAVALSAGKRLALGASISGGLALVLASLMPQEATFDLAYALAHAVILLLVFWAAGAVARWWGPSVVRGAGRGYQVLYFVLVALALVTCALLVYHPTIAIIISLGALPLWWAWSIRVRGQSASRLSRGANGTEQLAVGGVVLAFAVLVWFVGYASGETVYSSGRFSYSTGPFLLCAALLLLAWWYWGANVGWWQEGRLRTLLPVQRACVWAIAAPGLAVGGIAIAAAALVAVIAVAALALFGTAAGTAARESARESREQSHLAGIERAVRQGVDRGIRDAEGPPWLRW